MPIDKDFYKLNESYVQTSNGKMNYTKLRKPSSLEDVKKSTAATSAHDLDIKNDEANIGFANAPAVNLNRDEDSEDVDMTHEEIISMIKKTLKALEKHAKMSHDQSEQ